MKFYDKMRNTHDTRIGSLFGSMCNTIGQFLEDKFPGLNLTDVDIIDGDCTEIEEDDYEDSFFDTEDEKEETIVVPPTVGEVIENFCVRFNLNTADNRIEVINTATEEVVDRIIIREALTEGYIIPELSEYLSKIKTKESLDSLRQCLDALSIYNN